MGLEPHQSHIDGLDIVDSHPFVLLEIPFMDAYAHLPNQLNHFILHLCFFFLDYIK